MKKVGVLMGSDSDLPVVRKALDTLRAFGVPYEVHVYSAHRTPTQAQAFCSSARDQGFGVLICAAGMAAHLAGAAAANTTLPVIGIPMASGGLGGMDALLSTVQMPSGIPVATVAVNGAANAAFGRSRFWPWKSPPSRTSCQPGGPRTGKRSWKEPGRGKRI